MSAIVYGSGSSVGLGVADRIGTIHPTMNRKEEAGFLWCDGSVVSKEYYPDLYKMLMPNGSEAVHTLSGSSTDYALKNPFLVHVNGYLITFYYYTLWYKADTENTWHSVDWYSIYSTYPYGFYPRGVVWDDINNVFVFFVNHRNSKGSDYETMKTYYTSNLATLPTATTNCSLTTTNTNTFPSKEGKYWVIRENGSYGYSNGDEFYFIKDLLNGVWRNSSELSNGLSKGGADVIYADGRYVACGFGYDDTIDEQYVAYFGWAYTDVGADLDGTWHTKLLPETGQEEFTYGSAQYNGFDSVMYMPKRKMFLLQGVQGYAYYTYDITGTAYSLGVVLGDGNSSDDPYPGFNYITQGKLVDDVAYFYGGAIIDSENMKDKPVVVSCIPTKYPAYYLTDNMYTLGTNQILKILKTTPNLNDETTGLQYIIKANI